MGFDFRDLSDDDIAFYMKVMGLSGDEMKDILIAIETEISSLSRRIAGRTKQEVMTSDSQLALELVYQSYLKNPEEWMGSNDHNIQLMANLSMMSTGWLFFMLRAKSMNNTRYGPEQRKAFLKALMHQRIYHDLVIRKALELGEVYDMEQRWGVAEVTTEPIEAR